MNFNPECRMERSSNQKNGDVPGYVLVTGAGTERNPYVSTVGGVVYVGCTHPRKE